MSVAFCVTEMVRKYKRKSEMASYSANHLRDAVAAVAAVAAVRGMLHAL